jgi:hypothetical protein
MNREEAEFAGLPIVDLEIIDPRFPGQTFTGTVESVYKEMQKLKPELFANDTAAMLDYDSPEANITKRQSVSNPPSRAKPEMSTKLTLSGRSTATGLTVKAIGMRASRASVI